MAVFFSDAGVGVVGILLQVGGGVALAVAWISFVVLHRLRQTRRGSRSDAALGWRWVPVCFALCVMLNALHGPNNPLFIARFRMSEAALTREAQRRLQLVETASQRSKRVGLFVVERTEVVGEQVRFITSTCGVLASCGVVYAPNDAPVRWQEDTFSPLAARWWHLVERF